MKRVLFLVILLLCFLLLPQKSLLAAQDCSVRPLPCTIDAATQQDSCQDDCTGNYTCQPDASRCIGDVCAGTCKGSNNVTPTSPPPPPNPCPSQKGACTSIDTALGSIDVTNPGAFIAKVFGVLLSLSGGVAMILIILSGYRIMTAQGDPEKVKGAREMLTSAIIGLLFLIFSVTILQILGVDILHIPGFNK